MAYSHNRLQRYSKNINIENFSCYNHKKYNSYVKYNAAHEYILYDFKFLYYCCPVKFFSYGFREAGLTHPTDSQLHKSPFGELPLASLPTHSCAAPRLAVGFA